MVEETFIWTEIWKNQEALFTPWFFRMSAGTKLIIAFNNSGPNNNKKKNAFLRPLFLQEEFSAILIINAPKLRRSAGNAGNATFLSTEAPWPIVRQTTKLKSKYLNVCLIYGKP